MAQSRLSTALDDGSLPLPKGKIAVLRPPAGYDFADLPHDRLAISHSFRPDAAWWEASGHSVSPVPDKAAAALVIVPRSKALAHGLIAQACTLAPIVIVDGQRADGIDSIFNEVRAKLGPLSSLTKAHGRLFWFPATDTFAAWAIPGPAKGADGFTTQPGVFSESGADRGSQLLAAHLPAKLPARIADFGAGWGYLSAAALTKPGLVSLDLIEAEKLALDCAQLNITDPRARFHWADVTTFKPSALYDAVICNPPFHTTSKADPAIGRAFITAAQRLLTPAGHLWMVANRHLPYEAALRLSFRNVDEVGGDASFKIFHATRPIR
jgi:16S rRNA (guanine1207-N2)-methyltransferase